MTALTCLRSHKTAVKCLEQLRNWGNGIVLVPWLLYETYGDTLTMARYYLGRYTGWSPKGSASGSSTPWSSWSTASSRSAADPTSAAAP